MHLAYMRALQARITDVLIPVLTRVQVFQPNSQNSHIDVVANHFGGALVVGSLLQPATSIFLYLLLSRGELRRGCMENLV